MVLLKEIATFTVHTVRPDESIDRAIELMEQHGIHHLPVTTDQRVVGMLSDRDVLTTVGWLPAAQRRAGSNENTAGPTRVEEIMSRNVRTIDPAGTAREAARIMVEHRIGALPLTVDGRLAGIVTDSDLVRALRDASLNGAPESICFDQVQSRMSRPVLTVHPSDSVDRAVALFRRKRIRHLPVVEAGKVVGIVSDRDVRLALGRESVLDQQAEAEGTVLVGRIRLGDLMSTEVISIQPTATCSEAAHVMIGERVHSLVVLDGVSLMGIITETDIIELMAGHEL